MKQIALSLSILVLAAGWSALLFRKATGQAEEADHKQAREAGELRGELHELEEKEASLAAIVHRLSSRLDSVRAAPLPEQGIQEAVERWLAAHREEIQAPKADEPAPGAGEATAAGVEAVGSVDLQASLAELFDPRTSRAEREAAWQRIRKAGLMDQALVAFEKRARENPQNADFHSELGGAYIQKLTQTANDLEKGTLAAKADRAFDAALAIDDTHWDARFQKAMSLSFWPPIFGKKPEAINQFEILLKQAETGPLRPDMAQSYLFLGNLYLEQGKREEALSTWKKGLGFFPDHPELSRQLKETQTK